MPAPRRTRASAYDSAPAMQAAFANAGKQHNPPHGCKLQGKLEHQLWREIMSCRAYGAWTPAELAMAWTALRQELVIRKCTATLESMMAHGGDPCMPGTPSEKYAANLEKLRKGQLTTLRALGMTRQSLRTSAALNQGHTEREAAEAIRNAPSSGLSFVAVN